ncbi:MAG: molybdopterin cofactor-binding domain-containing protein [Pirellulales bacterium]
MDPARELLLDESIESERYELFEAPRYEFEFERRDFLKALGGGIVVCLLAAEVSAQEEQAERPRNRRGSGGVSQELSAWLHVAADGTVTVYSGKVEVGQNVRTSLTQAVAEELPTAMSAIRFVLADTELVPFDAGTFGSRSTPAMAPQIRRVAATARELLLETAAGELRVERDTLTIADGQITHAASGRSVTFAHLAAGKQLAKTVGQDAKVRGANEWKVQGQSAPKVNGRDIVTGKHQYTSDLARPGMLVGKVLRPASLHATLVSADVAAAQAIAGVTAVHDGQFIGVAAPSSRQAEQALTAIRAEWSPAAAISQETLYDALRKSAGAAAGGRFGRGNTMRGSIDDGLNAADHQVKSTYTIAYIAHAPLEPRAAVAEWVDGKLTVWTGTQRPFGVRGDLAAAFGVPQEKVRVIVPDTGSGYGGKHSGEAAIEAARLARAAGKPVKLVWTREEEFTWAYFRPAGVIDVTAGARNDGTLTAWDFHNYNSGGSAIRPLYEIPNQRVQFHSVESPLRQGSYRALAATANHFARECHIDQLAHAVGKDPLEFRLANLKDERLRGVLEAAAKAFGWGRNKAPAGHGYGIGGGSEKGSYVATCAEVAVDSSTGKVRVVRLVTAFECGAIVNPDHLTNQIEGAVIMGLGGALFEAIQFADDRITNPKFARYRVPRFSDVPVLETVLVPRTDLPSAGAGETPIVAVAPAIGNAIFAASGVRLTSLPMVPQGLVGE